MTVNYFRNHHHSDIITHSLVKVIENWLCTGIYIIGCSRCLILCFLVVTSTELAPTSVVLLSTLLLLGICCFICRCYLYVFILIATLNVFFFLYLYLIQLLTVSTCILNCEISLLIAVFMDV